MGFFLVVARITICTPSRLTWFVWASAAARKNAPATTPRMHTYPSPNASLNENITSHNSIFMESKRNSFFLVKIKKIKKKGAFRELNSGPSHICMSIGMCGVNIALKQERVDAL